MEETNLNTDDRLIPSEESSVEIKPNGKDVEVVVIHKSEYRKESDADFVDTQQLKTKLYTRRFLIMGIFCLYSMSSAFQWIEYAIITHIVIKYYTHSNELFVAWTSMIYMLSYIPLMFVATWMLDNWGLRRILLFGATLNAVGSLIKIASVNQYYFIISFVGQTVAACAQSFILEIPPKIASLWFGPSEVSTATSVGVFGNQLGVALGFLIPPLIVPDSDNMEAIAAGFRVLFISSAAVCTIVVFLIFFFIRDKPPLPPSKASAVALQAESDNKEEHTSSFSNYKRSIGALMKNVPFLLLLVSYGINTGTYYAIGTLLNPIMLPFHPDAVREIGQIGLTMVVAGLGGSVICGFFLDKTKYYKGTTVGIYVLSMVFMFVFTFTLQLKLLWLDFITIFMLGFFMTGYLPIGFEFGAELTYPESEATSAGLLNVSAQFFGILFILVAGELQKSYGILAGDIFMSVALLVGTVMTVAIKADLRRQAANKSSALSDCDETKATELMQCSSLNHNANNNSNRNYTSSPNHDVDNDDAKLIRLTSASSCYSADTRFPLF
uniref:Choline/ethanolamine transporter FLVCR1 n=1 Tax=Phallusia mammillata TaxID=59560 RepID=A0A6F9DCA5_9ASCI|nr:feline leukemia virus subgroup C receptor-related protein 2 [Phallusia mammillata]